MRWSQFFNDLHNQLESGLEAEELDLLGEEERQRLAELTLRDRIRGIHRGGVARGSEATVRVSLASGSAVTVRPVALGRDWFSADLVDESSSPAQCIIPLHAIASLRLSPPQVASSLRAEPGPGGALSARLGLAFVLRDLCRRRTALEVRLANGVRFGTIDRVGRDHLDLAVHERGAVPRASEIRGIELVRFARIEMIRVSD